jgi:hypothetical protein
MTPMDDHFSKDTVLLHVAIVVGIRASKFASEDTVAVRGPLYSEYHRPTPRESVLGKLKPT